MENNVQPSFIPKKPISQIGAKPKRTHASLFSIIATVIFVTVVVVAVGMFGYKTYEDNLLTKKQADLKTALETFQPSLVADLSRLDARLNAANDLINQHLSVASFFTALGNVTLKTVRFTNFAFSSVPGVKPTVTMTGQAQSFTAVALQALEFLKPENTKYINSVVISNPNLNVDGSVGFALSAVIEPNFLTYPQVQKLQGLTVSSVVVAATTTDSVATSTPAAAPVPVKTTKKTSTKSKTKTQ
jgi:hypothetical protein